MTKLPLAQSQRLFLLVGLFLLLGLLAGAFTPVGRRVAAHYLPAAVSKALGISRRTTTPANSKRPASPVREAIARKLKTQNKVQVELFVMSQCPFGVRAEEAMAPVLAEFGEQVEFQLRFIAEASEKGFASMHGQPEVEEDMRQAVMAAHFPEQYFDYVVARAANYQSQAWQPVATAAGIDAAEVARLMQSEASRQLFATNIQRANELRISASPTIYLDGEKYNGMIMPPKPPAAAAKAAKAAPVPEPLTTAATIPSVVDCINCDDNNACTIDTCDPQKGCISTPKTCDDNNPCTIDSCDPQKGCINTPKTCNDGNACTRDTCDQTTGKCINTQISCDDNNPCTKDTCDVQKGCVNTPLTPQQLDDNNACTRDSCDPNQGVVHQPIVCDDGNPFTTDSCDPAIGCLYTPNCPAISLGNPTNQQVLQGGTATFSVITMGNPTLQWQVSTDGGQSFTNIPNATTATLMLSNVTLAMSGYRYRVVANSGCQTSNAATLTVFPNSAQFTDPLVCLEAGGFVTITAAITNNGPNPAPATYDVTDLAPNLIGIPGAGFASVAPANFVITPTNAHWQGILQPGETVNFIFKAQIAPQVAQGAQVCITSSSTINNGAPTVLKPCTQIACPAAGALPVLSDQKAGSLLVFPYYTSKALTKADTRLTISNFGERTTSVHLFFIDGATCQQADSFLCLTPNASFSFKASEYDTETTGWLLAVAVDAQGRPVQYNGLVGNAFVNDGNYVDNYGAESFRANSPLVAAINGNTATLFFDGASYDAVLKQFAVEIQSPLDSIGQQVVTVGLNGNLTTAQVSGAAQVGTAQAFNEKEVFASFSGWLTGQCQARATIATNTPRVPNGLGSLIKAGQSGHLKFNVGGAVGVLLTPRGSVWAGIRTLHKTQTTTTSLVIPIFVPVC